MLRVSSYRRLFEEQQWGGLHFGGQHLSSARGGTVEFQLDEPDFESAHALNREGLSQFKKERVLIAQLNDRLAVLIDTARCLEEDNEFLEAQILELEGRLSYQGIQVSAGVPACSLEAVVERLRREKEQILCDMTKLKKELDLLQAQHDEVVKERSLVTLEREDIALDVDALTTDCLALKEQAAIYEEQLAMMRMEHETRLESMGEPITAAPVVTLEFPSPDVTPAILEMKEYYCQLAESLQFQPKATAAIAMGGQSEGAKAGGSGVRVADAAKADELKTQIAALQRELAELEKYGEELDDSIMQRKAAYLEEIEELEGSISELEDAQMELQAQMEQQCGDYQDLLNEKMARDTEIVYYRGLVEGEEVRLCFL